MTENILTVRALRTIQKKNIYTFSFFLPGSKLISIANISRIKRDVDESLEGFQRKEIKTRRDAKDLGVVEIRRRVGGKVRRCTGRFSFRADGKVRRVRSFR